MHGDRDESRLAIEEGELCLRPSDDLPKAGAPKDIQHGFEVLRKARSVCNHHSELAELSEEERKELKAASKKLTHSEAVANAAKLFKHSQKRQDRDLWGCEKSRPISLIFTRSELQALAECRRAFLGETELIGRVLLLYELVHGRQRESKEANVEQPLKEVQAIEVHVDEVVQSYPLVLELFPEGALYTTPLHSILQFWSEFGDDEEESVLAMVIDDIDDIKSLVGLTEVQRAIEDNESDREIRNALSRQRMRSGND